MRNIETSNEQKLFLIYGGGAVPSSNLALYAKVLKLFKNASHQIQ